MKKIIVVLALALINFSSFAQQEELQQLALNIEKLAQFKQILSDLKRSYNVLHDGYSSIKNIAQGNFNLHDVFLNGLLEASPAVKRYKKVADIISMQLAVVKEYKTAFNRFRSCGRFSVPELDYLGKVYARLFSKSLEHLDDLLNVLASKTMRMSDDERLRSIDKIYAGMSEKLNFLRHFNNSNTMLGMQRAHEQHDVDVVRKLYDIR